MGLMTEDNHHGVDCPNCRDGTEQNLQIEVKVWADLYDNGTDIDGQDHEWDSSSACQCQNCGWLGTVGQAERAYQMLNPEHPYCPWPKQMGEDGPAVVL